MNAHDVASLVVAFSSIEYAHKKLFKALAKHARSISHTFSPLQTSRTIYGFGTAGIEDAYLYRSLSRQLLKQRKLLQAKNVVEAFSGLVEADYTPAEVVRPLLADSLKMLKWVGGEDAIQLLHAVARLPRQQTRDEDDDNNDHNSENLVPEEFHGTMLGVIRRRMQSWWRLRPSDMADLAEVMKNCEDRFIVENMCKQFPRVLQLEDCSPPLFLRIWGSIAEMNAAARMSFKERLHRGDKIVSLVEAKLDEGMKYREDPKSHIFLLFAAARLGFDAPSTTPALLESVRGTFQNDVNSPWNAMLAWSLAELVPEEDAFAKVALELAFKAGPMLSRMDLLLALHAAVLLDVEPPPALLKQLVDCCQAGEIPDDLDTQMLRIVQLDHLLRERRGGLFRAANFIEFPVGLLNEQDLLPNSRPQQATWRDMSSSFKTSPSEPSRRRPAAELQPSASASSSFASSSSSSSSSKPPTSPTNTTPPPTSSSSSPSPSSSSSSPWLPPWSTAAAEAALSKALIALRIPHERALPVAGGAFEAAAALPERQLALLILAAEDLGCHSQSPLGTARARERLLRECGWRPWSLQKRDILRADKENYPRV